LSIIYGRRRIGKSTLISKFIENKKAIFYTATKVGHKNNLDLFSWELVKIFNPEYVDISFNSIEAAFEYLTTNLGQDKIILVIDELPYWAEKNEALLSIIQKYADTKWKDKELMIILCGSSLAFMENKVLCEKSPLFGRRDNQIKLSEFSYLESAEFVPEYSSRDKAICYGITGGIAKYLSLIDSSKSIDENIMELFFNKNGYLYEETKNLIIQEFNDVSLINNIIEQIASGENQINVIADKVSESSPSVFYCLDKLITIGIIEKRHCILEEKNKKKIQYILKDNMFRFWYRFVSKAISAIELDKGNIYYEKVVKPNLNSYMGPIFENMCRYYTLLKGLDNTFGCFISKVGTWWGNEIIRTADDKVIKTADIDIVGISPTDNCLVIGECKFKNEKTDKDVLDVLIRRSSIINKYYPVTKYLLFSLNGFSSYFDKPADNVITLSIDDLYN